jgi:hypothetical protein
MPVCRGGTRGWRGHNHGRAGRAILRLRAPLGATLATLLLALVMLAGPARAQATPDGNPLVQRDVPAEATAENAVVARDRALASGQRIAYQRMAAQMGMQQNLSDRDIDALVASLVIESERITPRGYAARITVNFRRPGTYRGPLAAEEGPQVAGGVPAGSGASTVEAIASYRSLAEYAALTRQLAASRVVARVQVLGITGSEARLRLSLRRAPGDAAGELAEQGVSLLPASSDGDGREGWRLSLGRS